MLRLYVLLNLAPGRFWQWAEMSQTTKHPGAGNILQTVSQRSEEKPQSRHETWLMVVQSSQHWAWHPPTGGQSLWMCLVAWNTRRTDKRLLGKAVGFILTLEGTFCWSFVFIQYVHIYLCLSVCLSIYLSIYLSIHLSIYVSIILSFTLYFSVILWFYIMFCLSVHLYLSIIYILQWN